MENIKYFIDFSLNEAKDKAKEDKTKEDKAKDYLFFNGNKLEFVENGKVAKTWTAVSGRTYYHWYMKPSIWNKRYTMPHAEWAKAKDEGPTPPGLYTLGVTQHRPSDTKWKTDANYVKSAVAKSSSSDKTLTILSTIGAFGGLYYAFSKKSGVGGYIGYMLLGGLVGSLLANVVKKVKK